MTTNSDYYQATQTTVMLLAAGEGRRMLPLTTSTPKPLLKVGPCSLLEHHLLKLSALGFKNIVINIAHLSAMIKDEIGDGSRFDLHIQYSDESKSGALETAGGIVNALASISSNPFLVINADIYTNFDFSMLLRTLDNKHQGRLVLVKNPLHNSAGDFSIDADQTLLLKQNTNIPTYTFSGIALYKTSIFENLNVGKLALAPILRKLISEKSLANIIYDGAWTDVGTPERLKELNSKFS